MQNKYQTVPAGGNTMFDYLVESIAIAFIVGTILGALIALQFSMMKFKSMEHKQPK